MEVPHDSQEFEVTLVRFDARVNVLSWRFKLVHLMQVTEDHGDHIDMMLEEDEVYHELLQDLIVLYVVFKLDESYTSSKVSIRAGDGFHNLKEIKTVELVKPTRWVYLSLSGVDPS
ncbi:hypothetical protein JHK82_040112 [Glycine max]|nr:hypothetical protein JHK82_040112 [Glycine max]KAG5122185.1 hypothetical protein JHK84_040525 [Glycine max]